MYAIRSYYVDLDVDPGRQIELHQRIDLAHQVSYNFV